MNGLRTSNDQYSAAKGFHVEGFDANRFRDRWGHIHARKMHPELYDAKMMKPSRKGIDKYDITLHPCGLPHGPQPGATEASIGAKQTEELAVMVDTFHPLNIAVNALEFEKPEYWSSWLEGDGE